MAEVLVRDESQLNLSDLYSPFTGKGYNPRVEDLPWKGVVQKLKLKEEHGRIR